MMEWLTRRALYSKLSFRMTFSDTKHRLASVWQLSQYCDVEDSDFQPSFRFMSETVQNRAIVTMEDGTLSNVAIFNDLKWSLT